MIEIMFMVLFGLHKNNPINICNKTSHISKKHLDIVLAAVQF